MNRMLNLPAGARRQVCVVVPVHNEQDNLPALVQRLSAVAAGLEAWDLQVLLVDDGSRDASVQRMRELRAGGIPVGFIELSRNFGHQAAICAGMEAAPGDVVITMDADLQHPPEQIPRMLEAFEGGADVVQMVRSENVAGSKGLFSDAFYAVFNRISDTPIIPNAADFRLLARPVLDALNRIPEREKFLRGLIPSLGFQQTTLEFEQAERLHGKPSYTFRKSLRLARKALFDFSLVPLKLVFWSGMGIAVMSFLFGLGHIVWKLIAWHQVTPGFTDIISAIFFLSGCILASVGILGRYMAMILEQVRGRPVYVVREHVPGLPLRSAATPPMPIAHEPRPHEALAS